VNKNAINLMRYDFALYNEHGLTVALPPSGQVINVNEKTTMSMVQFGNIEGPVQVATVDSQIDRVPSVLDDVAYIVPMRALLALHEQGFDTSDIYAPNMLVKDNNGKIIGCRRLMQLPGRKK